jgi:acyl carrier protein
MVPQAFVCLDAFPLTANGKLDRGALPAPDGSRAALQALYVEPQTPVEQTLAAIWSEVLGVERVGLDDDFFDLGGHSLLAVRMLARAQDGFDVEIRLSRVFERSTLRELAEEIATSMVGAADEDELASLLAEIEAGE